MEITSSLPGWLHGEYIVSGSSRVSNPFRSLFEFKLIGFDSFVKASILTQYLYIASSVTQRRVIQTMLAVVVLIGTFITLVSSGNSN